MTAAFLPDCQPLLDLQEKLRKEHIQAYNFLGGLIEALLFIAAFSILMFCLCFFVREIAQIILWMLGENIQPFAGRQLLLLLFSAFMIFFLVYWKVRRRLRQKINAAYRMILENPPSSQDSVLQQKKQQTVPAEIFRSAAEEYHPKCPVAAALRI